MRTTKPISTISFNTPDYLELKLNQLTKSGRISFWAFIFHQPEDDEGGKKHHCHVYIEPSKMLQTDDIKSELLEYDPTNSKPLGCLSFTSSKFDPWYMYSLHDKRYLATKGQSRKYSYKHDDIVTSDADDLLFKAKSIDMLSLSPYEDMLQAQAKGFTWAEYFARGQVPLPQVKLFEQAWYLLLQSGTDRGGRSGHYNSIDEESGELIEKSTESPEKSPQSPEKPTWCGATLNEWASLYENATSDSERIEWDPDDDDLPY